MDKVRVGILYGGESGEHEVSVASAASILRALDSERFVAVPIGITRNGEWLATQAPLDLLDGNVRAQVTLADSSENTAGAVIRSRRADTVGPHLAAIDVVFPVLHGPRGEDGTVQGLLELAGIPYVGSGVLASAVSMDKAMMKAVFATEGLPGVPYVLVSSHELRNEPEACLRRLEERLSFPVFVKPCNMGSSVGISKSYDRDSLRQALEVAARFDRRVIVEQGINAREVECGVLGNEDVLVSVPGEVVPHGEFYDYASKYTEGLADLRIPADLTRAQSERVMTLARRAFRAVDAAGLARVDFFVRRDTGEVLVNEINTMPGFTATSMYPRLWEASGVTYDELVGRLLTLALDRHAAGVQEAETP